MQLQRLFGECPWSLQLKCRAVCIVLFLAGNLDASEVNPLKQVKIEPPATVPDVETKLTAVK